jgi:hypothetical protein
MTQRIPSLLKNLSPGQVALTFLKPPVGSLIVAMGSTFGVFNRCVESLESLMKVSGIYFIASFLYVSIVSDPLPAGINETILA